MKNLKQQRDYFGDALLELGQVNPNILVLTADLESSLKLTAFKDKFPERFINVGVAEQNLIGVAVGLSFEGYIPFAASFAVFLPGRCFDQIRVSVCQNKANVKLVGGHLGFSNSGDGASAQSVEDIALMRSLSEMVVLCPYDGEETKELVKLAAEHNGPVYLRISKSEVPSEIKNKNEKIKNTNKQSLISRNLENEKLKIGGARILKEGKDLTILSHGPILGEVLGAVGSSQQPAIPPSHLDYTRGYGGVSSIEVIDAYSIKPLDKETILKSCAKTGKVLVVEEHSVYGGLGSAVAELLSQEYPVPLKILGIKDVFGESARSREELLAKYGLNSENISRVISSWLKSK